jgi:sulfonate transport system permease protein
MAVVAAELIAATTGIGYRMSEARGLMRSDVVIVCMIIIGLIGIAMDKFISSIFRILTPWKRGQTGEESSA